jgi:hypothetical protein
MTNLSKAQIPSHIDDQIAFARDLRIDIALSYSFQNKGMTDED